MKRITPIKRVHIARAVTLFRPVYLNARADWDEDPNIRLWLSKERIMSICQWPYPDDWATLRDALWSNFNVDWFPWGPVRSRCWSLVTSDAERKYSIQRALRRGVGVARGVVEDVRRSIAPTEGRDALEGGWELDALAGLEAYANNLKMLQERVRRDWELEAAVEAHEKYGE